MYCTSVGAMPPSLRQMPMARAGSSPALFQTHAVIGFAVRAVARDLSVNVRAARLGPLHLFHHEEPGTLGQHEAVAILGEGPRGACGLIVPTGGQDAHQLEAAQD